MDVWSNIVSSVNGPFPLSALFVLAVLTIMIISQKQITSAAKRNLEAYDKLTDKFIDVVDKNAKVVDDNSKAFIQFSVKMEENTQAVNGMRELLSQVVQNGTRNNIS